MMNDVEFWPEIRLRPIEGSTRSPLRRTLARTVWRRSPLASIWYEPERDQLLIQLVDAPTVAEAVPYDPDGQEWHPFPHGESAAQEQPGQFAGFDGTESYAWPTMIAVVGFSRCLDRDARRIRLVKELCGDRIWTAACSAAHNPHSGLLEVPFGQDSAEFLIRRWHAVLASQSMTEMSGPAIHGGLAEEAGADAGRTTYRALWPGDHATTLHGTGAYRGGQLDGEP